LIKPVEYAKELGISRQAVYAKIKRGILKAKNVEGKLYIIVNSDEEETHSSVKPNIPPQEISPKKKPASTSKSSDEEYEKLLQAKDETIGVLKGTVKDLKKSNKQMSTTLRGEIDLLKQAFHEMRSLYIHQIEQMKPTQTLPQDAIDVDSLQSEPPEDTKEWIGTKRFLKKHNITKEKEQEKILKKLKRAYKRGDQRIIKIDGKLKTDPTANFQDIL
jgi:hypothetical protein